MNILFKDKPKTVGELKDFLEKFDDNTHFGFRNQPYQDLEYSESGKEKYLSFAEPYQENNDRKD